MFAQLSPSADGDAKPKPTKALPELSVREWKLKNGLNVAHVERAGLPMVTVQVWYRFGSADEPKGEHGAARAFERLMYLGSERVRDEDHRRFVTRVGGETSALVAEDVSAYHDAVPVDYFDLALELESERMRRLWIRSQVVEGLRPAMLEDVRRQEVNPVARAYLRLLPLLFKGSPYEWAPLGVPGDIEKLSAARLKALYSAHYVPSNALLVIVGGVSADAATKAAERWFGPVPAAPAPTRPESAGESAAAEPRRHEMAGSPIGLVMAGYRLPPATDADVLALQVAGVALSNGTSSRLHRQLVDGKLAEEVGGQVLVRKDGGLLLAFARFSGGGAAKVEQALVGEIDRLVKQGLSAVELRRAKGQIVGAAWLGLDSATSLANQIGVSWGLTGKPTAFLDDLARLEKLSNAEVRRAAAKYLARSRLALVVAEPTSGATP